MPVPALRVACAYGDAAILRPLLEVTPSGTGVCLLAAVLPPAPADPLAAWFARPSSSTIEYLRQCDLAASESPAHRSVVILWVFPASDSTHAWSAQAAAIESLRGIVQSVTREKASEWGPVNGVAVRNDDMDSAAAVLRFLGDPDGHFTAGSTFDLISKPGGLQ